MFLLTETLVKVYVSLCRTKNWAGVAGWRLKPAGKGSVRRVCGWRAGEDFPLLYYSLAWNLFFYRLFWRKNMILVIDNYDSFTFNVVQSLQMYTKQEIRVVRNDEYSVLQLAQMKPDFLVVSPGPGNPSQAGVSVEALRFFAGKVPILGICLGHQAIGEAFGAKIVHAKNVCHGIIQDIELDGKGLFRTIGKSCKFTRYHSLVIDEKSLSSDFEVTARAKDGDIMGIRHKTLPIEGVQFHP